MNVFQELSNRKFYVDLREVELSKISKDLTQPKSGIKIGIKETGNKYEVSLLKKKLSLTQEEFKNFVVSLENLRKAQEYSKTIEKKKKELTKTLGAKKFQKYQDESLSTIVQSFITFDDKKSVAKKLTKNTILSQYSSIIFLILKKGSSQANIFDYSSARLKTEYISASKFNTIFNTIKKSKKSYFFEHEVISNDLNLVGNILGNAFEIENTNIVFLLSKGDLLPPTQKENTDFKTISEELKRNFSSTQNQIDITKYIQYSMEILKLLNINIKIKHLNKTILSNSLESQTDDEFKTDQANLNFYYTLRDQGQFDKGDLFQHQRILLLGELFNILKHELSNPIFGINMALNVLKELFDAGELQELFDETVNASERSLRIFETMTDLFSSDSIKKKLISPVEILSNLKLTLKSELRHINYQTNFSDEVKAIKVNTDPSIVNQILFNLVRNAVQDLKEKEVQKPSILISVNSLGERLIIQVTDNSRGLPDEYLEKIFQPKNSYKKGGSGLGLSISKNLAKKIDAELYLVSTSKQGTTFQFDFPIK